MLGAFQHDFQFDIRLEELTTSDTVQEFKAVIFKDSTVVNLGEFIELNIVTPYDQMQYGLLLATFNTSSVTTHCLVQGFTDVMAERTVDKAKRYATLYNAYAYVAAYPKKSKQVCQQEFNVKWTELKKGEGLEDKGSGITPGIEKCRTEKQGIPADFLVKTNSCSTSKCYFAKLGKSTTSVKPPLSPERMKLFEGGKILGMVLGQGGKILGMILGQGGKILGMIFGSWIRSWPRSWGKMLWNLAAIIHATLILAMILTKIMA
eukprot:Em0019g1022a